jgi:putative flippase GtrA
MPDDQDAYSLPMPALPVRAKQIAQTFSVRETLSYGWVGLIGVTLDAGAFFMLRQNLQWHPIAATILSATTASVLTFPLNRHFTFRKTDQARVRLIKYIFINLSGVALGAGIMFAGHTLQGFRPGPVKAASIVMVAGTQFLLNKFVAFK